MKPDVYDLVIKNGLIVNADASFNADVAIKDGKIVALGGFFRAAQEIDAKGLYLLPGGIDIHTHLEMPFMSTFSSDNFESGSKAAAMGGTTTVVDYAMQEKGDSLSAALKKWHEKAANKCHIDYGFHLGLTDIDENILTELESLTQEGVSTVKLFMAYNNALRCPDIKLLEVLLINDYGEKIYLSCRWRRIHWLSR